MNEVPEPSLNEGGAFTSGTSKNIKHIMAFTTLALLTGCKEPQVPQPTEVSCPQKNAENLVYQGTLTQPGYLPERQNKCGNAQIPKKIISCPKTKVYFDGEAIFFEAYCEDKTVYEVRLECDGQPYKKEGDDVKCNTSSKIEKIYQR